MVPLQRFVIEYRYRDNREDRQRNCFLDDLQLHQAEGAAIDFAADGVGGNHEEIFDKRNAPRRKNHKNQWPVGADVHFFEFEVAVPSESHENVGAAEEENCKNTSFHF